MTSSPEEDGETFLPYGGFTVENIGGGGKD